MASLASEAGKNAAAAASEAAWLELKLHPSAAAATPRGLCVEARVRREDSLALRLEYELRWEGGGESAPRGAAAVAAAEAPARRDGLWESTCLEAFVRAASAEEAYWEVNVSPGGDWQVYAFDAYRRGARPEARVRALPVRCKAEAAGTLRVGLAAVVEAGEGGALSYWALAHAPARPDFHAAEGFVCALE
jgi:hypothetical protein